MRTKVTLSDVAIMINTARQKRNPSPIRILVFICNAQSMGIGIEIRYRSVAILKASEVARISGERAG